MAVAVSSEAVAEHFPRVHRFALRFNKVGGAEYDDLFQEGSLHVLVKLQRGQSISNTGIKNAMRDWVRKCARRGLADALPDEA